MDKITNFVFTASGYGIGLLTLITTGSMLYHINQKNPFDVPMQMVELYFSGSLIVFGLITTLVCFMVPKMVKAE